MQAPKRPRPRLGAKLEQLIGAQAARGVERRRVSQASVFTEDRPLAMGQRSDWIEANQFPLARRIGVEHVADDRLGAKPARRDTSPFSTWS